ncbi:hypothetical protein RFI_29626, partial [Reticulomyxa filosa]
PERFTCDTVPATYNDELIICGCSLKGCCYSYHKCKNKYKFICSYPSNIELFGYCVVKLGENIFLSFGDDQIKHHKLVIKYQSIWDYNNGNEINKSNNFNKCVHFKDNQNNYINIARNNYNYIGARAVIGEFIINKLFSKQYKFI